MSDTWKVVNSSVLKGSWMSRHEDVDMKNVGRQHGNTSPRQRFIAVLQRSAEMKLRARLRAVCRGH